MPNVWSPALKKAGRPVNSSVKSAVAAKMGGADPAMNARLFTAVEKAKKESVTKDAIQRAINKGAGIGDEKLVMEHVVFEGHAPHNVPVIVEVYTDNVNRTAPEIRVLFKKGQLGTTGSNKFLFDHVGLVEAHHPDADIDREAAAIEAGANEFETLIARAERRHPRRGRRREIHLRTHGRGSRFQMALRQWLDRGDQ